MTLRQKRKYPIAFESLASQIERERERVEREAAEERERKRAAARAAEVAKKNKQLKESTS